MADTLLTTTAVARVVLTRPRKAGEVASLVRGRTVADALRDSRNYHRVAPPRLSPKLSRAPKANALNNDGIDEKSP